MELTFHKQKGPVAFTGMSDPLAEDVFYLVTEPKSGWNVASILMSKYTGSGCVALSTGPGITDTEHIHYREY